MCEIEAKSTIFLFETCCEDLQLARRMLVGANGDDEDDDIELLAVAVVAVAVVVVVFVAAASDALAADADAMLADTVSSALDTRRLNIFRCFVLSVRAPS